MIQRFKDGYDLQCDHCAHTETIMEPEWTMMVKVSKVKGWNHKKRERGDWIHLCVDCDKEIGRGRKEAEYEIN